MTSNAANDYGHLVVTIKIAEDGTGEAILLNAHDQHGNPAAIYVELASGLKGCRCGAAISRARVRVVAPRDIRILRVPHDDIPAKETI
jgi:hypothetical protein